MNRALWREIPGGAKAAVVFETGMYFTAGVSILFHVLLSGDCHFVTSQSAKRLKA